MVLEYSLKISLAEGEHVNMADSTGRALHGTVVEKTLQTEATALCKHLTHCTRHIIKNLNLHDNED